MTSPNIAAANIDAAEGATNIRLTDAARERVRGFLSARPQAVGLRFGVKKTGCSGFAYVIDITDEVDADDRVIDADGVPVVVDAQSFDFVRGTEIDFVKQGLGSAFVFRNPNVTGECGCGESFTIG